MVVSEVPSSSVMVSSSSSSRDNMRFWLFHLLSASRISMEHVSAQLLLQVFQSFLCCRTMLIVPYYCPCLVAQYGICWRTQPCVTGGQLKCLSKARLLKLWRLSGSHSDATSVVSQGIPHAIGLYFPVDARLVPWNDNGNSRVTFRRISCTQSEPFHLESCCEEMAGHTWKALVDMQSLHGASEKWKCSNSSFNSILFCAPSSTSRL